MAGATGLEPATPCVTGMYSNQLNYAPTINAISYTEQNLELQAFFLFLGKKIKILYNFL